MVPRQPIDELSLLLGEIKAKVDLVTRTQAEDRQAAASWRTDVRKEMAGIRSDIGDMKGTVTTATKDLEEIKPIVADYVEDRAGKRERWRIGQVVAALGGGSAALGLQWLLRKFGG